MDMASRSITIMKLHSLSLEELMNITGTRMSYDGDSKLVPIRTREDLDAGKIYSEIKDKGYRDSLITEKDDYIPTYDFRYESSQILSKKLLSFCGDAACIIEPEEDYENIMKYGQFWLGKSALLMKGVRSRCHNNACRLWINNKHNTRICTGYALSKDGIWRQHSWLIMLNRASNKIIETTVKRVAYFGFVMDEETAEEFCIYNL